MTVLDASAAITLLLADVSEDSPQFEGDFAAPDLLLVEVVNALRRTERRGAISPVAARAALAEVLELPVELTSSRELVERAFELRHNVSVMDGCSVALAEQLSCGILTSDARIARTPGLTVPFTLI
jgi:predicted nucleic acid-binding protein